MPRIKFSHTYSKLMLPNGAPLQRAVLLDAVDISLGDMAREFLDYDTDDGTFVLPKRGEYLMLIFKKFSLPDAVVGGVNLFTTLRRSTPEKRRYYRNKIGFVFDVVIVEGT